MKRGTKPNAYSQHHARSIRQVSDDLAKELKILQSTYTERETSISVLIFSQLLVFLPFAMIRNIAKLSLTALIADVFILIGIIYIGWNEISVIAEHGIAPVRWFNEKDFPLLIGYVWAVYLSCLGDSEFPRTAVFSFEGVGLVIPITDAMREPRKFPNVLTGVMFFLIGMPISNPIMNSAHQ